jgi:hypothetical protein
MHQRQRKTIESNAQKIEYCGPWRLVLEALGQRLKRRNRPEYLQGQIGVHYGVLGDHIPECIGE